MKSTVKRLGFVLIVAGFLLFVLVISNFPSGYWSQGVVEFHWYKRDVKYVNGNLQVWFEPGEGDPTNEELTQIALKLDPSFFDGCPVNVKINLRDFPGGLQLIKDLYMNGYKDYWGGFLFFEMIPSPSHSLYGYIGAVAGVVIGLILIMIGRRKTK